MLFNRIWTIDHGPWTIDDRRWSLVKSRQSSVFERRIEELGFLQTPDCCNISSSPLPLSTGTSSQPLPSLPIPLARNSTPKSPFYGLWTMVYGLLCIAILLSFSSNQLYAQADSLNKKRLAFVGATTAVGYTGTMLALNQAWYANYPRSSFHFIDDNAEWLQIDKAGHAWTAQNYALIGIEVLKWTGLPRKKAIWIGGLGSIFFQTSLEVFDGFSEQWGASGGDMIANTLGTALVVGQELAWDEQRFQLKFSFHPTSYAAARPNLLGNEFFSRTLKDYNGQTYWLSVNPWSFAKESNWPKWLNVSLGYGANGMLGGHSNVWEDSDGITQDYSHIARQRQFYLSMDIDLQHLPIKNPFLRRLAKMANIIKIPAPTLMYQQGGKWQFYPLYF